MKKILCILCSLTIIVLCFLTCCKSEPSDMVSSDTIKQEEAPALSPAPDIQKEQEPVLISTSFVGVGDNIIYGTKEARLKAVEGGRKYNYKPYYDGVSDIIRDADISFINQETLMCGEGYNLSYYPMFNSPQELGHDLYELGFDIINIANNHMLDKGAEGLSRTIEFWKGFDDIVMIGGYENQSDYDSIRYIEKDGLKIALLSYAEMTNGLTKSASSEVVIPYLDEDVIAYQTSLAKQNADLIFVSVHWGDEGSFTPNENQIRYARIFADCGVDVILGHHPHVIQPVEWLEGENGHKTLCVYSLGNFMAQQDYDYNMVGGMISFDIIHSDATEPSIQNVLFTPTVFHFNGSFTDNNVYLMSDYTKELSEAHGVRRYYGHTFSYDRLTEYVKNTIDKEFLPEFFHSDTEQNTAQ